MPCYFNNGVNIVVFQLLRIVPNYRDGFMIQVIAGKMPGKMLFNNVVGIGSSLHNLDLVLIISFCGLLACNQTWMTCICVCISIIHTIYTYVCVYPPKSM